jgi:hypothetical protein
MRSVFTALAGLILATVMPASGQNYSGTYVTPNQAGGNVPLVLVQSAQGQISGTLYSGGVTYNVAGVLEEGSVLGTASTEAGGVYFMAEFDDMQLFVTLIEPDANNQPNYDLSQTLVFTRQGGPEVAGDLRAQPGAPLQAPGNPLARQQNPLARPPANPLAPAGQPTQPGAMPGTTGVQTLEGWNIQYTVPANWQVSRTVGRMQVLSSNSEAGAIFVAPGLYNNFNEIVPDVTQFYQTMGLMAYPVEQPSPTTVAGFQAMTSTYMSQDQMGQVVHSRIIALLTPHGTGLVTLAMTTPNQMPQLRNTAEQLAASLRAQAPQVNQQAVAALAGRWMYYAGRAQGVTRSMGGTSRSHEEYVTFDGRGSFQWQSSSSVTAAGALGAGNVGGASANSDQGTYTVIGNTLIVKGRQGQQVYEIQLLGDRIIADGRTYLRAN